MGNVSAYQNQSESLSSNQWPIKRPYWITKERTPQFWQYTRINTNLGKNLRLILQTIYDNVVNFIFLSSLCPNAHTNLVKCSNLTVNKLSLGGKKEKFYYDKNWFQLDWFPVVQIWYDFKSITNGFSAILWPSNVKVALNSWNLNDTFFFNLKTGGTDLTIYQICRSLNLIFWSRIGVYNRLIITNISTI